MTRGSTFCYCLTPVPMKKALKSKLPDNILTKSAYSAMRLKDKFNITTKTVKVHQHDITCYVEYPEENCNENYVGETGRRLSERVIDHNGRDKNKFRRKFTESLLIKKKRSTFNI